MGLASTRNARDHQRSISLLYVLISMMVLTSRIASASRRFASTARRDVSAFASIPSSTQQKSWKTRTSHSFWGFQPPSHQNNFATFSRSRFCLDATKRSTSTSTKEKLTSSSSSRPYKLVIVESPSKCKTIENILNQYVQEHDLPYDYRVTSCYGHIRNLPKNQQQLQQAGLVDTTTPKKNGSNDFPYSIVGVDLQNDYTPTYVLLPGKEELVEELQTATQYAQQVILATDPDREGEAIAWHLQQVLGLDGSHHNKEPPLRWTFAEITPRAIRRLLEDELQENNHENDSPSTASNCLNTNLVQAQETRRILDRLAGFTVSPVLWKKIAPGLSAGRVQSVGMALVVQRERERLLFHAREYWDLKANFTTTSDYADDELIQATLVTVNGTKIVAGKGDFADEKDDKNDELNDDDRVVANREEEDDVVATKGNKLHVTKEKAQELRHILNDTAAEWTISSVESRTRLMYPPECFKTSTLQQEANQRLGLSVSETMRTAQQLYEAGLISYMRTDATHVSDDAHDAAVMAITQQHGPDKVYKISNDKGDEKSSKRKAKKKSEGDKFAQEAHEAIRPAIQSSGTFSLPEELLKQGSEVSLPEKAHRLYQLIYQRTMASRMPPQKSNQTTVTITGTSLDTTADFRATGSVVLDPGFTVEWGRQQQSAGDALLPPVVEGQDVACRDLAPQSHMTQPPPRYTEASLVKELESRGVGRPSTYAGIVQILRERAYVGSPVQESSSSRSNSRVASGAAISAQRAAGGGDLFGARGPLVPSLSAFVVCDLLEQHLPTYVDPSFTARMEERLDQIAHGELDPDESEVQRISYLNEFYAGDQGLAARIKWIDDHVQAEVARRANLPALNGMNNVQDGNDGQIGLFIGPWGPYIQKAAPPGSEDEEKKTAPLPPGMATDLSTITPETLSALLESRTSDGAVLGSHPEDGRPIRLKVGRFGAYLQWGETGEEGTTTHSLPKQLSTLRNVSVRKAGSPGDEEDNGSVDDIPSDAEDASEESSSSNPLIGMIGLSLEDAVGYCGLPRTITLFDDKPIIASIGPYGPYLKYNNTFMSLHAKDGDVLTVDAETAKVLVTDGIINKKSKGGRGVLADLGEKDGSAVTVKQGRFGAYLNWKKVNAKLPAEYVDEPDNMPLEEAWTLIQAKAAAGPGKKGAKKVGKGAVALPPGPKRPKSSYLHFCAEKRPEVSAEIKSLGDISKKLAEMWAAVSDEERQRFDELATQSKAEYEELKKAWKVECDKIVADTNGATANSSSSRGRQTKKSSNSNNQLPPPPKRNKSAYLYFCEAMRPEVSKTVTKLGDISKELARQWSELEDRTEYEVLAGADKARYQIEKQSHEQQLLALGKPLNGAQSRPRNGATKKTSKTVQVKAPRAPSAYMLFCREMRGTIVDDNGDKLPLGETTKQLAQLWKNCDPDTRARFDSLAAKAKEELQLQPVE